MALHQVEMFPECKKSLSKDEAFDLFWNAYPRKIGTAINGSKFKARQAWDKIVASNRDLIPEILAGAKAYREWAEAEQHRLDREAERNAEPRGWPTPKPAAVCYPSTWLNQKRWEKD